MPLRAVRYALRAGRPFADRPVTLRGATRALAHPAHALPPPFAAPVAAHRLPWWTAALAHPAHALGLLGAAVRAAAAVALVRLEVHAPVVAASLSLEAGAHLVVSAPYAVPRTALGVPAAFPSQSPAIVGPGHPWY